MKTPQFRQSARMPIVMLLTLLLQACISVPVEVIEAHTAEKELIHNLQASHIAMVDAFVDQKLGNLEQFYFETYAPAYLENWKAEFKSAENRDYSEGQDFALLYSDLVAEYQNTVKPLEDLRGELKLAINTEYRNVAALHDAMNGWLKSAHALQGANKAVINQILGAISPGLTIDSVEKKALELHDDIQDKIDSL